MLRSSEGKDLYACGAGVHVPSIRAGGDVRRGSVALANPRSEPLRRRRRTVAGGNDGLLRSHVGELRRSLTFTEDVVSTRSPHSVSYRQARRRLADVFLPALPCDPAGQKRPHQNRPVLVGARRHLCYLNGPPPSPRPREKPSNAAHYISPQPSYLQPLSSWVSSVPSHPSGMLYRKMRTVPVAKSVQWEEQLLGDVTSSTAVRLGGDKTGNECEKKTKRDEEEKDDTKEEVEEGEEERKEQNYAVYLERGAKPVWRRGRKDFIVLDNNTTFTKVLERRYPQPHSEWCGGWEEEEEEDKSVVKGGRRWTALPQPAPIPEHLQWVCGEGPQSEVLVDGGLGEGGTSSPGLSCGTSSQYQYCRILKEWSRRRSIHTQPEDCTEIAVLRNIQSLNDSTRAKGMVACAWLTHQRGSSGDSCEGGEGGEVVRELERIVRDPEFAGVHVPAAIALHCLGRGSEVAVDSLLEAVRKRSDNVDEWAGLQCLVEGGVCEECVVERCQLCLLNSSDSSVRQRAGKMLARLSDRMPLVRALLAEQLTSRGWQERMSACQVLPSLLCPLSADVCNHLVVMSWEDWSSAVRDAASQALGKTGHGKLLHDELVRRLSEGTEVERLDALKKMSSLHLMTPQLLSIFLPCLSDQHASIRIEAISICGQLAVRDEAVVQSLVNLLGDPIWNVRARTLRALRSIGVSGGDVIEQLMWSVRCDKVPAVRAEACRTLSHLWQKRKEDKKEEDNTTECRVLSTLRDRLVVEESTMVSQELVEALRRLGVSEEREDPMSSFITSEVRRLGTCQTIRQGVLEDDRQIMTDYIISRPLTHLTTRDYLTPHQREKFYSNQRPVTKGTESACKRVWSPDRDTIEEHLTRIGQLCLASKPPSQ